MSKINIQPEEPLISNSHKHCPNNAVGYSEMELDMLFTMAKYPRVQKYDFKKKYRIGTVKLDRAYTKLKKAGMFVYGTHHVERSFYDNFIVCFVGIVLDDASLTQEVCETLVEYPQCLEIYPITGTYNILVKVVATTSKGLFAILSEKLQKLPGVVKTEAFLCGPNAMFNDLRGPWGAMGNVTEDPDEIDENEDPDVIEARSLED